MNDGATIVSKSELERLNRFRRRWLWGWVGTIIFGIFGVFEAGRAHASQEFMRHQSEQLAQLREAQVEHARELHRMEALLQSQTTTAKLLASWGQLVMDRAEIGTSNVKVLGVANRSR